MADHKYIERKWKNGRWEYKYRTDKKSSDQLRRETVQEKNYRDRMINQSQNQYIHASSSNSPSRDRDRAIAADNWKKNTRLYDKRIPWNVEQITDPDSYQDQLRNVYKGQFLRTKIKADARSAADDIKEQAGKAKKAISEKTTAAKKTIAEKTAAAKKMANDATRKISSLSSKAVDNGKATVSKILDKFKKK